MEDLCEEVRSGSREDNAPAGDRTSGYIPYRVFFVPENVISLREEKKKHATQVFGLSRNGQR